MSFSIALTLTLIFTSCLMIFLSKIKILKEWPKVAYVALASNTMILLLYLSSLYGHLYYLVNIIKIIPLIMLLVYFASKDPSPSWSYRAMCLVFIVQIFMYGTHVGTDLNLVYYDQLNIAISVIEFIVIITGGLNVRASFMDKSGNNSCNPKNSNLWAKQNYRSGV